MFVLNVVKVSRLVWMICQATQASLRFVAVVYNSFDRWLFASMKPVVQTDDRRIEEVPFVKVIVAILKCFVQNGSWKLAGDWWK